MNSLTCQVHESKKIAEPGLIQKHMKLKPIFSSGRSCSVWLVVCLLAFRFLPIAAHAHVQTLTDNNSTVTISDPTEEGMKSWLVDGQNQLYQQWFWYRIGGSGPEQALNTIPVLSEIQANPNTLVTTYANSILSIEASYTLLGGAPGSGSSEIVEQIRIRNLTGSPLDFHFFQYTDFDVNGTYADDSIQLYQNLLGLFDTAIQNEGNVHFADTIVSPGANHGEAGLWPSILNKLNDSNPTTLNDDPGPKFGDSTWAFQWDQNIAANGDFVISADKKIFIVPIPEPTVLSLVPMGLIIFGLMRRGRRHSK